MTVERAQRSGDVYLILDQVEEFFVYHADDHGFDADLARLVGEQPRVNVLLSLREDSLAKLDRFKARIPAVYANSLRLDRLDRDAGRMAIVRPVECWNELENAQIRVDQTLVETVLDGVRAEQIEEREGSASRRQRPVGRSPISAAGHAASLGRRARGEIERAARTTLESLGGARQIVADHLERAIADLSPEERDVAALLFTYLVTPSGTKIAHEVADLADFGQVMESQLVPVLTGLSERRILRSVDEGGALRYEIFHDVLGEPVLAWRAEHEADRELAKQKEASSTDIVSSLPSSSPVRFCSRPWVR